MPALVQHLGHISDGNIENMPEQLADFVDFSEAGGFTGRPREFAQRYLVEANIYREAVEWMDRKYVTGKALDAVIRSDDALTKALGGGGLLAQLGSRVQSGTEM